MLGAMLVVVLSISPTLITEAVGGFSASPGLVAHGGATWPGRGGRFPPADKILVQQSPGRDTGSWPTFKSLSRPEGETMFEMSSGTVNGCGSLMSCCHT